MQARLDPWLVGTVSVAVVLATPVVYVASFVFHPSSEVWTHLVDTVLADYIVNSLLLLAGVGVGTLALGVSTAWLTTSCEFPGRRFFDWALLLPLAFPAYIIAYTYTGMFEYAGPVQSLLREWFGWSRGDYWFPNVRSLGGAIVMLSLVLYPYVYFLTRAAFLEQSAYTLEVARTLGCNTFDAFRRVSLPFARPAIVAGLSLALMEALSDYGTVQYFGVSTFTTGIFRTWFGLGDAGAAAQLSVVLLVFVFALLVAERYSRRRARYHHVGSRSRRVPRILLGGWHRWGALGLCGIILVSGFALPGGQLLLWSIRTAETMVDVAFWRLTANTVGIAFVTAVLSVLLALLLAYALRLKSNLWVKLAVRVASMGYAVPGIVVAVGVLLPFAFVDNTVDAWMRESMGVSTGLLLSGTLFALVFAYLVRFLAVSMQAVESGLGNITLAMDETARSLGHSATQVVRRVHVPILTGSLLTAGLLVFVDVMKELPATLILRPFNFNTLAVRAYELASDERLADSASAAVSIVLVGLVPVILLSRSIARARG